MASHGKHQGMVSAVAQRPAFDFITDQEFRRDLEANYDELEACAGVEAWKAVYVLAGSIIEAVLVDYLINTKHQAEPDPLHMGFDALISACRKAGVLGQQSADLSRALRNYRNLIHPGRKIRLGESVDSDGALVAQSLVRMIVKDVAAKQQKVYGLTAEQIIGKFESDPSALGISAHLLKDAPPAELERLIVDVVPSRYFTRLEELDSSPNPFEQLQELETLFREAIEIAPEALKKKAMQKHVGVLKEDSGTRVRVYEERFFRAADLAYAAPSEAPMVRDHLLARLNAEPSQQLISVAERLGEHLDPSEPSQIDEFVDTFIRIGVLAPARRPVLAPVARKYLEDEAVYIDSAVAPLIRDRLDAWEYTMVKRERADAVEQIHQIQAAYQVFEIEMDHEDPADEDEHQDEHDAAHSTGQDSMSEDTEAEEANTS